MFGYFEVCHLVRSTEQINSSNRLVSRQAKVACCMLAHVLLHVRAGCRAEFHQVPRFSIVIPLCRYSYSFPSTKTCSFQVSPLLSSGISRALMFPFSSPSFQWALSQAARYVDPDMLKITQHYDPSEAAVWFQV